mmetsp:Transcript_27084/g.62644  ORF Transcript_27084/g.62644 Transcript_27084/m.62644 type:complete len:1463 (+) Transcript_27084:64-4452(+)
MAATFLRLLALLRLVRLAWTNPPNFHIGNCHDVSYPEVFLAKLLLEVGGLEPYILTSNFTVDVTTAPACGFDEAGDELLRMLYGEGAAPGRFSTNGSEVPPVVAIAGCGCSSGTKTLSLLASSSFTPVVSGKATNPGLHDVLSYPSFMRTIPNDNAQAETQARLFHEMGWKEVTWLAFESDTFGTFFVYSVPVLLGEVDLHTVYLMDKQQLRSVADWPNFNISKVQEQLATLFPVSRLWPRIITLMFDSNQLYLFYLRELLRQGVIGNHTVIVHPENMCDIPAYNRVTDHLTTYQSIDTSGYFDDPFWLNPAMYLYGSMCTVPNTESLWLHPNSPFLAWLGSITREALDGAGVPPDVGFPEVDVWLESSYRPLVLDSALTILLAIGELLHYGTPVEDIYGQTLFNTMIKQKFPGVSGNVSFSAIGERLGRFSVKNLQIVDNGGLLEPSVETVFTYEEVSGGNTSLPNYLRNLFIPGVAPVFRNGGIHVENVLRCGLGLEPSVVDANGARRERCVGCPTGKYKGEFQGEDGQCEFCLPTSFTNVTGQTACSHCEPGRFSPWFGLTECTMCPSGSAQDLIAQMHCSQCIAGTFASQDGASYCDPCPRGTYAEADAQTACTLCPNGTETLERNSRSSFECACPEGTYLDATGCVAAPAGRFCPFRSTSEDCYCLPAHRNGHDGRRTCIRCEDHLYCPGGHRAEFWMRHDATVQVEQGYMTLPEEPYSVYECISEQVCEGRRSPFNLTSPGRVCIDGVKILARCGRCEDGKFGSLYGTAEEGCSECPESHPVIDTFKMLATYASSFFAIVYLYARFNRPQPSAFITISLMISVVQSLQTFGQLQLVWPDILQQTFDFIDLFFTSEGFMSLLELRMECVSGQGYTWEILRKALSPLIVFAVFVVMWPLAKLVRRPLRWVFVHNIIGLIFTRLFIAIIRISLALFFRLIMPNGKVMVSEVPELEFMSDDWFQVLPIGLLSTLIYTSTMVSYITHLVMTAPKQVVIDKDFMSKARFCFGSIRPDRHWWVLVQLAYAFAVNFSQVCTPTSNIHFKLYMTLFFLILFVIIAFSFEPFKFAENNRVDIMFNVLLVTLLVLATSFIDPDQLSESEVEYWNNAYAYVIVALFLLGFIWAASHVFLWFLGKFFEKKGVHEGKRAQFGWEFRDCTVAMLLVDDVKLLKRLSELGDYDLYNLKHATRTMISVLLGEQVSKRSWKQRLIPGDEFKLWNYHDMQLMASESIGNGHFELKVAQSYRVRAWVLQMAMALGEVKATADEEGQKIVENAIHGLIQEEEETYVDRLTRAWGIDDSTPVSRATFHANIRKSFPKLKMPSKDIEALFKILDMHFKDEVLKSDVVLTLHALLPASLLETLSKDDIESFEQAVEGRTDENPSMTTGSSMLRKYMKKLLTEDQKPEEDAAETEAGSSSSRLGATPVDGEVLKDQEEKDAGNRLMAALDLEKDEVKLMSV